MGMFSAKRWAGAAALAAAVLGGAEAACAAASPWWRAEHGAVRLVAASDTVGAGAGAAVSAGLHFRMNPGWKIYWRSPGDAGFPPRPDWTGSANLAAAELRWPVPERFSVLGLETLGYAEEVVLPVAAALREPGAALALRARVPYLTCSEICVPYEARLVLHLPAGDGAAAGEAGLIDAWSARVPAADGARGGLRVVEAAAVGGAATSAVEIRLASAERLAAPDVYVEGPEGWSFAAPETRIAPDGRTAWMRVAAFPPGGRADTLAGREIRLTARDGARAVERTLAPGAAPAAPPRGGPEGGGRGLAAILLLAVLGGAILNLMPCVLPVLSLKLLSVVGHGGSGLREIRAGFLASAAGIGASFLVLGTGAAALRLAGEGVGWGIQFQQPAFLVFMAAVVALFAANLFGLFEIGLPGAVFDTAAKAGGGSGVGGHFAAGAFAALLATPCTAPFLGTAIGFALSRGVAEIYAVFAALGAGLALPYLAVAAFPRLAAAMPKPGPWMVVLRRLLGVALAATAVWLLSVLAVQTGAWRAVGIGAALAVMAGAVGFRRRAGPGVLAVPAAAAALAFGLALWPAGAARQAAGAGDGWVRFDPARLAAEVAAGQAVLVDVTADWCITCQVNKALVLDAEPVSLRLAAPGVVAMRADWTRPDAEIARYLRSLGRYGIPFNAVYGPGAPEGVALPEILTARAVTEALDRAAPAPARLRPAAR